MSQEMSVEQFAVYVASNLNRATLANAMNIADKIDNPSYYTFEAFNNALMAYLSNSDAQQRFTDKRIVRLLCACYNASQAYTSEYKYNKRMIIDNYVIDLWNAVNR